MLELGFECCQIRVECLVEQTHLFGIELLAAFAELLALEYGQFVRELVNARLTVMQLPFLLTDFALFLFNLDDQFRGQRAKLFRAEGGEICR